MVIQHFKQIRKVKKLYKWVSRDLTTNQKNRCFEVSSSLVLHKNNEPFLNWIVTCDEKWILYDNWLSGWTEKFQSTYQSQTCTSQTHYNFLNPGETITSEKYAQQVDYYYYFFLKLALVNRKGPIILHNNS